jgi:hypothetical protein
MTEIEKTEGEIKVLQAKLELLKEMENHKTPVEEAYKVWWGYYPPTTPSVSNAEDERWRAFQMGYKSAQVDYKVEEPTPKTLYDIVRHTLGYSIDCCDEIVDAVEEWIPDDDPHDGEEYQLGWNACLKFMRDKLR